MLFDSDTILKRDIDFVDDTSITAADIEQPLKNTLYRGMFWKKRFLPYVQMFNVDLIKQHNLKYIDYAKICGLNSPSDGKLYDTGAYFYECVANLSLPYKTISHKEYITHLKGKSQKTLKARPRRK